MTITSGFFNSVANDRKYDATQMSSLFDGLIRDGVFISVGDKFAVTQSAGLSVNVGTGRAWFNRTWTYNDAVVNLAFDAADVILSRIDAVVLEINTSDAVRANDIKVIKGTPATNPTQPPLTNTDTVHYYPLAYVSIIPNLTEIIMSHITNMVGTSACPFVTGVVANMNIDSLIAQWNSEFDEWFNHIKDTLSGDIAGNLQLQIDALDVRVDALEAGLANGGTSSRTGWNYDTDGTWSRISPVGVYLGKTGGTPTPILTTGTRVRWQQPHNLSAYFPLRLNGGAAVGGFTTTPIGSPSFANGGGNIQTVINGINLKGAEGVAVTGNLIPFKPTNEFTLGFWFRENGFTYKAGTIFSSGTWASNYGFNILLNDDGTISFSIGNGASGTIVVGSTGSVQLSGDAVYIVCTYKSGVAKIYIDGALDSSARTGSITYHPTEHYVRLGCQVSASGGATNSNFVGTNAYLDDLFFIGDTAWDEISIRDKYLSKSVQGSNPVMNNGFGFVASPTQSSMFQVYLGNDSTLIYGLSVSNVAWSNVAYPVDFPMNRNRWDVVIGDSIRRAQTNPVNGTWYTLGSVVNAQEFMNKFLGVICNVHAEFVISATGLAAGSQIEVGLGNGSYLYKLATPIFVSAASIKMPITIDLRNFDIDTNYEYAIMARVTTAGVTSLALENAVFPMSILIECPFL